MGIENKKNSLTAFEILANLYDGGIYTEISPSLSVNKGEAEVITACGKVNDENVYVFVQCEDRTGGAMSVTAANKLIKLYSMALKTGNPIVGIYKTSLGRISEGNMLLDAFGELLAFSAQLSGVVPQISVILGDCVSATAVLANNADFIVKTKDSPLSISDCGCAGNGKGAVLVDTDVEAVESVRVLLSYLPANNLTAVITETFEYSDDSCTDFDSVFDLGQKFSLYEKLNPEVELSFNRLNGNTVGVVKTSGQLEAKQATRTASFVRFCDAFSIPVITAVDCEGFKCLGSTKILLSAYAEATVPKISVITGKAYGVAYMTLAGRGAGIDAVIGIEGASISPLAPEATAYIVLGDKLKEGTVAEQDKLIKDFIDNELSVTNAASQGFIDDTCDYSALRGKLVNYFDILKSKRVETLPKKHNAI
ncbi:MAG: carboxyl transferase domain-containing protein [Ruminococcus sp.]